MVDRAGKEIRVGLFVALTLVVFVALVGVVSGSSLRRERALYRVRFEESVKGMVPGARVNFQGVPIGAVRDMRFDDGGTLVEIEVEPGKAELQTVTRARLDRAWVTGQVTIELEGYEAGAAELVPGAMIDAVGNPIDQLAASLPEVIARVDQTLVTTQRVLHRAEQVLSADNLVRIERGLAAAETTLVALPQTVAELRGEARETLAAGRSLFARTEAALEHLEPALAEAAGSVDRSVDRGVAELAETLVTARRSLVAVEELAHRVQGMADAGERLLGSNQQPVRAFLAEARDAMRELRVLARQLQVAPSGLLFGVDAEEITVPASPPARGRR